MSYVKSLGKSMHLIGGGSEQIGWGFGLMVLTQLYYGNQLGICKSTDGCMKSPETFFKKSLQVWG